MSTHSLSATTTESKALDLLGSGAAPTQVALALGVDPSYISQLLAQEDFARQVTERRYQALIKNSSRDAALDSLEDALISKMKNLIPLMCKPSEIIHAFTRINQAKRRALTATELPSQVGNVISLTLPIQIVQHFQVNSNNQVIKAGAQDLVTVQSGRLPQLLSPPAQKVLPNEQNHSNRNETVSSG